MAIKTKNAKDASSKVNLVAANQQKVAKHRFRVPVIVIIAHSKRRKKLDFAMTY
jgi:hypothetical protein